MGRSVTALSVAAQNGGHRRRRNRQVSGLLSPVPVVILIFGLVALSTAFELAIEKKQEYGLYLTGRINTKQIELLSANSDKNARALERRLQEEDEDENENNEGNENDEENEQDEENEVGNEEGEEDTNEEDVEDIDEEDEEAQGDEEDQGEEGNSDNKKEKEKERDEAEDEEENGNNEDIEAINKDQDEEEIEGENENNAEAEEKSNEEENGEENVEEADGEGAGEQNEEEDGEENEEEDGEENEEVAEDRGDEEANGEGNEAGDGEPNNEENQENEEEGDGETDEEEERNEEDANEEDGDEDEKAQESENDNNDGDEVGNNEGEDDNDENEDGNNNEDEINGEDEINDNGEDENDKNDEDRNDNTDEDENGINDENENENDNAEEDENGNIEEDGSDINEGEEGVAADGEEEENQDENDIIEKQDNYTILESSFAPGGQPSGAPTGSPGPFYEPSAEPSMSPSERPTWRPSSTPTMEPHAPSSAPTFMPSFQPTTQPTQYAVSVALNRFRMMLTFSHPLWNEGSTAPELGEDKSGNSSNAEGDSSNAGGDRARRRLFSLGEVGLEEKVAGSETRRQNDNDWYKLTEKEDDILTEYTQLYLTGRIQYALNSGSGRMRMSRFEPRNSNDIRVSVKLTSVNGPNSRRLLSPKDGKSPQKRKYFRSDSDGSNSEYQTETPRKTRTRRVQEDPQPSSNNVLVTTTLNRFYEGVAHFRNVPGSSWVPPTAEEIDELTQTAFLPGPGADAFVEGLFMYGVIGDLDEEEASENRLLTFVSDVSVDVMNKSTIRKEEDPSLSSLEKSEKTLHPRMTLLIIIGCSAVATMCVVALGLWTWVVRRRRKRELWGMTTPDPEGKTKKDVGEGDIMHNGTMLSASRSGETLTPREEDVEDDDSGTQQYSYSDQVHAIQSGTADDGIVAPLSTSKTLKRIYRNEKSFFGSGDGEESFDIGQLEDDKSTIAPPSVIGYDDTSFLGPMSASVYEGSNLPPHSITTPSPRFDSVWYAATPKVDETGSK